MHTNGYTLYITPITTTKQHDTFHQLGIPDVGEAKDWC